MPTEWKTIIVTLFHKSGDKDDADYYWQTSVLPVLSKIIVNLQVIEFLENNTFLSRN